VESRPKTIACSKHRRSASCSLCIVLTSNASSSARNDPVFLPRRVKRAKAHHAQTESRRIEGGDGRVPSFVLAGIQWGCQACVQKRLCLLGKRKKVSHCTPSSLVPLIAQLLKWSGMGN
jgi:hypothetical protein